MGLQSIARRPSSAEEDHSAAAAATAATTLGSSTDVAAEGVHPESLPSVHPAPLADPVPAEQPEEVASPSFPPVEKADELHESSAAAPDESSGAAAAGEEAAPAITRPSVKPRKNKKNSEEVDKVEA